MKTNAQNTRDSNHQGFATNIMKALSLLWPVNRKSVCEIMEEESGGGVPLVAQQTHVPDGCDTHLFMSLFYNAVNVTGLYFSCMY